VRQSARLTAIVLKALSRPASKPLALSGRSGSGKTSLLRSAGEQAGREIAWFSATELVTELVDCIRDDRYASSEKLLAGDERPICVEHLEDLEEKPVARRELQLMLAKASAYRPVLLTVTRRKGDRAVHRWLESWTRVVSLG
jgi:hypothetical protein